jgi:transcription termination factor Rho
VAAQALEQSVLESKDKDQLLAIAKALGVKASARNKKAEIIGQILEMTGSDSPPEPTTGPADTTTDTTDTTTGPTDTATDTTETTDTVTPAVPAAGSGAEAPDSEPPAEWELDSQTDVAAPPAARRDDVRTEPTRVDGRRDVTQRDVTQRDITQRDATQRDGSQRDDAGRDMGRRDTVPPRDGDDRSTSNGSGASAFADSARDEGDADGDGESRNRRRRRRRKGKGGGEGGGLQGDDRDLPREPGRENTRESAADEPDVVNENDPVEVAGFVDLRDEGYGFLRVNGYLPSREDSYIPVKLARQYALRKGDHLTGLSRPPGRNEKNPALLEIRSVNELDPEAARQRPRFEDLTALFPDQRLKLADPSDPTNMTARIIDLVSPIGKGQRGIIVSPPKAGKTTIMKTIATAIERNNPEVTLMVLLIDERPEEVTDMRRTVKGEVISSTFDRPSEEHTHVAEMTIERAKRLVEKGEDVVIILDGITRLSRAYNLAAPPSGRILSGGIDAGALYPPKKFFGAARNVEEGGSLTILATALVETNSRMDDAIFEEFKGTGNMELRLDRRLAERRVYPAIDVDASSTRHEELLFDRKQLQMVWKLRRVLSGLAAEGNAAPGLELLIDRLKTFRTNEEFLNEIAKQPAM